MKRCRITRPEVSRYVSRHQRQKTARTHTHLHIHTLNLYMLEARYIATYHNGNPSRPTKHANLDVQVFFDQCAEQAFLTFNGEQYNLIQFHIHSPSEHAVRKITQSGNEWTCCNRFCTHTVRWRIPPGSNSKILRTLCVNDRFLFQPLRPRPFCNNNSPGCRST